MVFQSIRTATTGLMAQAISLKNAAHNIANTTTPNATLYNTVFKDTNPGVVAKSVAIPGAPSLISNPVNAQTQFQAPQATTSVTLGANLSSGTPPGDNITSQINVFDSLGAAHTVQLTFTKGRNPSEFYLTFQTDAATSVDFGGNTLDDPLASLNGASPVDPPAGTNTLKVTFGTSGELLAIDDVKNGGSALDASGKLSIGFDFTAGGANAETITFNLGTVGGTDGLTQFAGPSDPVRFVEQNGNAFEEPPARAPTQAELGAYNDPTLDLLNMTVSEHAFKANAQVIRTADEMLEDLLDITT